MDKPDKHLIAALDDIKKVYNLSESDVVCLQQMLAMISILGYSKHLTYKLLQALTAMFDVIISSERYNAKP